MQLGSPVGVLLETITSSELTEWVAFSTLEPFGGMVEDMRAGLGPATTINVNSSGQRIGPLEFFPWHQTPVIEPELPPPDSPEEVARRKIMALAMPG